MHLPRIRPAAFSRQLIVVASVAFNGCAMRQVLSDGGWTGSAKELNMEFQDKSTNRNPVPAVPEMVGATSAPFYIGPGNTQMVLPLHPPTGPALKNAGVPKQVFLSFENIKGTVRAPSFRVYLNAPPGDPPEQHPELFAGNLTMFGLVESSVPRGNHGGEGKTMSLDITDLFSRLVLTKNWDTQSLRMIFVPADWDAPVPRVQVGHTALYFR